MTVTGPCGCAEATNSWLEGTLDTEKPDSPLISAGPPPAFTLVALLSATQPGFSSFFSPACVVRRPLCFPPAGWENSPNAVAKAFRHGNENEENRWHNAELCWYDWELRCGAI